jgi:hypothetical protein
MQLWGIHIHIHALKEYLNLCNKHSQCTCIKYVLSHGFNYQHVSLAFMIIRIVLQKYHECSKLPNCISGTHYNRCLILLRGLKMSAYILLKTKLVVTNKWN